MQALKKAFIFVSLLFVAHASKGQDVSFSQFFSNHLYLNPAYVGNLNYQQAQLVYRSQWLTTNSPYMSYGASYDRFFIDQNSGLGILVINDMQGQGALNWLSAAVLYSYNIQVAYNAQIRGGVQAGGVFKSQNTKNLIFPDMIDQSGDIYGSAGFPGTSRVFPDFAAGVVGEWDIVYGGVAVHHLAEPTESKHENISLSLRRKYTVHLGCDINLYRKYIFKKSLILSPNIIYQQQFNFRQINLGLYLVHKNLVTGLWLRENLTFSNHTFIFMAGYNNQDFSVAYSYDFSIFDGGFRGLNTSSHEVTFGMNFQYKHRSRKKIRQIKYPKI